MFQVAYKVLYASTELIFRLLASHSNRVLLPTATTKYEFKEVMAHKFNPRAGHHRQINLLSLRSAWTA